MIGVKEAGSIEKECQFRQWQIKKQKNTQKTHSGKSSEKQEGQPFSTN